MNKRILILSIIGLTLIASSLTGILLISNLSNKEENISYSGVSLAGGETEDINAVFEEITQYVSEEKTELLLLEDDNIFNEIIIAKETIPFDQNIVIAQTIQAETIILPFKYTLIPESPMPGDPVTIGIDTPIRYADLIVNGSRSARARGFSVPAENGNPAFSAAIFAVPSTVNPGNAIVRLTDTEGATWEIPITIAHREFRSETLTLTPTMSNIITTPDPQRTIESERLWEILSTTGNQIYHYGAFIPPVASTRRTSLFGARRINVYPDGRRTTDIHAGVDFGAPVAGQSLLGAEVYACGRGMVILSRSRIVSGNSIILEHAPGVYSIYYHLDSVIAQEGTIVEVGEIIGLVGSTGFSTGAHLHWEIRVSTENTDPDAFVARPLIDKNLIISRLFY